MRKELHEELQAILLAEAGERALEHLVESCRRRSVAGVCGFRFGSGAESGKVEVVWLEDFSGELADLSGLELAQKGFERTPAWLLRWIQRRKKPFHLSHVARFIPFSAAAILRASAGPGVRPLGDLILVPYRHGEARIGALVGMFEPFDQSEADELVLLASACLARQPWSSEPRRETALNERQLECLQWIVAGKSLEETATITGMSYSNVRYHLERAKKQTDLASLQQLIAFAAVTYQLSPLGPEHN